MIDLIKTAKVDSIYTVYLNWKEQASFSSLKEAHAFATHLSRIHRLSIRTGCNIR